MLPPFSVKIMDIHWFDTLCEETCCWLRKSVVKRIMRQQPQFSVCLFLAAQSDYHTLCDKSHCYAAAVWDA